MVFCSFQLKKLDGSPWENNSPQEARQVALIFRVSLARPLHSKIGLDIVQDVVISGVVRGTHSTLPERAKKERVDSVARTEL